MRALLLLCPLVLLTGCFGAGYGPTQTKAQSLLAAGQFDLICKGRASMASWELVDYGEVEERVRVDLHSQAYCLGQCDQVATIAETTPDRIVLQRESAPPYYLTLTFDRHSFALISVNEHRSAEPNQSFASGADYSCRISPFSGFQQGATQ